MNTKVLAADGEGDGSHKPDDGGMIFALARTVVNYFGQATQKK